MLHAKVSWTKQLILAVFLFGLGTTAYWLEYKQKPEQEEKSALAKKIFPELKDMPFSKIKIMNGPVVITLRCMDYAKDSNLCKPNASGKWEVTQSSSDGKNSKTYVADSLNTNGIMGTLLNLSSIDILDQISSESLKDYGLSEKDLKSSDARKLEIETQAGHSAIYLGSAHPMGTSYFTSIENTGKRDPSKIYLLQTFLKSHFEHNLTYWRDKKVLSINPDALVKLKINDLELRHDKSNKHNTWAWTIHEKGKIYQGDPDQIQGLLTTLTGLTAKDYPDHTSVLSGATVLYRIELQEDKSTTRLTVYEKKTKNKASLYAQANQNAKNADLVELDAYLKDKFKKSLKELRYTKLLTSIEKFMAKTIEISGKSYGSEPLTLIQKDSHWIDSKGKMNVDSQKVVNILDRLSGNRIKDFLTGSAIPAGETEGITFKINSDPSKDHESMTRHFVLWKSKSRLYAKMLTQPDTKVTKAKEALEIDPTIIDSIPWEPKKLEHN